MDLEDIPSSGRIRPLSYGASILLLVAEDLMQKFAVSGLRMPSYANRLCSACGFNLWAGLYGFCRANQGLTVEGEAELCAGLDISPSFNTKHAILMGKCAIQSNKELEDFVKVPGCPPILPK